MNDPAREFRPEAGAKHRARFCLTLALMVAPVMARAGAVTVALDSDEHACRVRGSFVAPISDSVAWRVLSDYDHIPSFVSSMVSSHADRQPDGRLLVRQVAVGGLFILKRRVQVTLDTQEEPERRIQFHDVLLKDFKTYSGEWRIEPDSAGTRVSYRLAAEPRGTMARTFCRHTLRGTAEDLLEQVRAEMLRRKDAAR